LDMAPGGAALLRQAAGVLRDHALAVEVGRHAQQRAYGDDPRAANAADDDAPGAFSQRQHRFGQRREQLQLALLLLFRFLQRAAFDGDEARAEALEAGEVLVAAVLVDATLAAELGFHRFHRQAVGLLRA